MSDKRQKADTPGTPSTSHTIPPTGGTVNPSPVHKGGTSSERSGMMLNMRNGAPTVQEEPKKIVMKVSSPNTAPQVDLAPSWTDPEVRCMPKYYPFAKTHRTLSPLAVTIQEVLNGVCLCLKAMSCHAKYCNDPASAYVLTWEHVELQIAFWKAQTGDGIIVEVIYRRGDPITFHKYAQDLLDAAQGDFDAESYERRYGQTLDVRRLKESELLLRSQYPTTIEQDKESCIASLATAYSLLTDDYLTARILGMQSLCVLADPRKTGVATSVRVARIVLQGEGPNQDGDRMFREIRDYLINLIQNRVPGLGEVAELESESTSSDSVDSEQPIELQDSASLMHSLAFTVLCDALEATIYLTELCPDPGNEQISAVEIIQSFLDYAQNTSGKSLIKTLVNGIFKAEEEPHVACRCVIALRLLCIASAHALREAVGLDAINAAYIAYCNGSLKHGKLEVESSRFLRVLQTAH